MSEIVTLPPSPAGEITHNEVREKINEVTGRLNVLGGYVELTGGDIAAVDASLNNVIVGTVIADVTLTFSNIPDGFYSCAIFTTNAGAFVFNYPANTKFSGGTPPALTAAGEDIIIIGTYNQGATWFASTALDFS